MTTQWHTVHVRVNDAATARPTPVRIRFARPSGEYFAPFGRLTEFACGENEDVGGNVLLGTKKYAYIDGTCEVQLPAGPLVIAIHKGPQYTPQHHEIDLAAGKLALRYTLERWLDLRREGWYAGDMRAHFLPPHAALLEGAAEDLAVVNLLALEDEIHHSGQWSNAEQRQGEKSRHDLARHQTISNILAFSGQQPALQMPGHLVVVNTLNYHLVLGSLSLLNCHRAVYPLRFGPPDGFESRSLADWCDQCHRKNGFVVWSDFHDQPGEALADLILGKVDALELDNSGTARFVLKEWYRLLNCGFRVPLVGASGKITNREILGSWRTYARLQPGEELTYSNWIEAVRTGRVFVTEGPLLSFTVEGRDAGSVIDLAKPGQCVRVRAEARSRDPFDRLEVITNGVVVASAAGARDPANAAIEKELTVPISSWIAARCLKKIEDDELLDDPLEELKGEEEHELASVSAHSSPVYVNVPGQPLRAPAAPLLEQLQQALTWVQTRGKFENDHQREHLAGIFQAARQELLARMQ